MAPGEGQQGAADTAVSCCRPALPVWEKMPGKTWRRGLEDDTDCQPQTGRSFSDCLPEPVEIAVRPGGVLP